jgi:hypothetical protein
VEAALKRSLSRRRRAAGHLGLEVVEGLGDEALVLVVVDRAPEDLLGGLNHHAGDLAADVAYGALALAAYLLAGPLDDAVALLAGLLLRALALGVGLLAGVLQDAPALAAGLLDLAPVLGQKLAGFFARLLRLVDGALDLCLALLDLVPDRRVDVPDDQEQQNSEGDYLPEEQASLDQIEDARRIQHTFSLTLPRTFPYPGRIPSPMSSAKARPKSACASTRPMPTKSHVRESSNASGWRWIEAMVCPKRYPIPIPDPITAVPAATPKPIASNPVSGTCASIIMSMFSVSSRFT